MTYADGLGWRVGTQALPVPAGASTANLRGQDDDGRVHFEQQTGRLPGIFSPLLYLSSIPGASTYLVTGDKTFR